MIVTNARFAFLALIALSTVACSGIRVVRKTPEGGTVALRGPEEGAREKAADYMRGQCPAGYDIVEESEAVVGQDSTARTSPGLFGPTTHGTSEDRREWRVTYKCKGSASGAARAFVVTF